MARRYKCLAAVVLLGLVPVLLMKRPQEVQQPDCTVVLIGVTNTPAGRFVQFALSNSGPCAIEVGHYGTYWSGQRPSYQVSPQILVNRLYDIAPGEWRGFTTSVPLKSSNMTEAKGEWRLEIVYRKAERRLQQRLKNGQSWLNQMWPGICASPTERRLVLSTTSDWILEGSENAQDGAVNASQRIRPQTNRTSSTAGFHR